VRRVIALIAAALLVLTIAGPVAADPIDKSQFPTVYEITCGPGTVVPDQYAHGVPGWDVAWKPGDNNTPWLLLGFTMTWDGGSYVRPLPPGLADNGKLIGPCEIAADGITDAWFLQR
jgi:hypothetical protein